MGEHAQHRNLVAAALFAAGWPAAASDCRLALSLGLDVSSSVDAADYALQAGGLVAALRDRDVARAFLAAPGESVALHVFEWSGRGRETTVVDWTEIDDAGDLAAVAGVVEARGRTHFRDATALGDAMLFGAEALADRADCGERVLDLSGDGEANNGASPLSVKRLPAVQAIAINGLTIGPAESPLKRYYEGFVIQGPGAFVETAEDFADFGRAMRRKLIRETLPKAVSGLGPAAGSDRDG